MQFLSSTLYLFAVSITTSLATPTATATSGALKARETDEMIPANLNITIYDYPDCDNRGTNQTLNPNYDQNYVFSSESFILSREQLPAEQIDRSRAGTANAMTLGNGQTYDVNR